MQVIQILNAWKPRFGPVVVLTVDCTWAQFSEVKAAVTAYPGVQFVEDTVCTKLDKKTGGRWKAEDGSRKQLNQNAIPGIVAYISTTDAVLKNLDVFRPYVQDTQMSSAIVNWLSDASFSAWAPSYRQMQRDDDVPLNIHEKGFGVMEEVVRLMCVRFMKRAHSINDVNNAYCRCVRWCARFMKRAR